MEHADTERLNELAAKREEMLDRYESATNSGDAAALAAIDAELSAWLNSPEGEEWAALDERA